MTQPFAAFPPAEHRARLAAARAALRRAGLAGCVCVAPEHHYYLFGYDSWVGVNGFQAVVFGSEGDEPTLVARDVDLPLARETTWLRDVRGYRLNRDDPAALVAEVVADKGLAGEALGVEAQSHALTWDWGRRLARALAPSAPVDATALLGDLRLVKSPAELVRMRRAAARAEAGLEAMRRSLRPGLSEVALAGEIEAAVRRAGSDYWAIPVELASGARSEGGHATPRDREIEPGDLVHAEFAGVDRRYHSVAIATMAAGEPGGEARDLYDLTRRSLEAGVAAVRPGAPVADVEEASLEPLRRAGLAEAAMMRFGYGVGIAYPPVWLETLQIARGVDRRLEPGTTFVLHACVTPPGSGLGAILGGTWLLADDGVEMLAGAGARDLETPSRPVIAPPRGPGRTRAWRRSRRRRWRG